MSRTKPTGRDAVEAFFNYRYDATPIARTGFLWPVGLGLLAGGIVALGNGVASAVLIGGGVAFVVFAVNWLRTFGKRSELKRNEAELTRLANETRKQQSADVLNMFMRAFDRAQLDRDKLRVMEQRYMFETERDLFDEETLQERLGDLMNKSLRLLSWGAKGGKFRQIHWSARGHTETFFNPLRLVSVFIADKQFVICDVTLDSATQGLKEELLKVPFNQVVSVKMTAERKPLELSTAAVESLARDRGFSDDEVKEISADLASDDPARSRAWVKERSESVLELTKTDGRGIMVPIRSSVIFGKNLGALDQAQNLSGDERAIDRMVGELNRMIEHA